MQNVQLNVQCDQKNPQLLLPKHEIKKCSMII